MSNTLIPIEAGTDPETGHATFGYSIKDVFVTDPTLSECGRFTVDPMEAYGLTPQDVSRLQSMSSALKESVQVAIAAGCPAENVPALYTQLRDILLMGTRQQDNLPGYTVQDPS